MLDPRQDQEEAVAAELCNGSVGIRPFTPADVSPLFDAIRESLPEICAWMVWCRPDYSRSDCSNFISDAPTYWQSGHRYSFAIFDKATGTILGSIGLSEIHSTHKFARVGYWVRTNRTRRGVASTALKLAARFAFEQAGLQRLEIVAPLSNQASRRAAEKAGAAFEGILRSRVILGGQSHDAALYSLVSQ
jgi:RimJ/RimL family protein N-acetyltransferase